MRENSGQYVLLDPGIAFDLEDISLTAEGFVPHTPGFIAPECVVPDAKRDADCRSDFFLLGVVLYICATGRHPFMQRSGMRNTEVITSILRDEPLPVKSINPGVSDAISTVIMRLLTKGKHSRFKNAEILMRAFHQCEEN
jgi:eukaryotic-like serine/threonine-protein kinase